MRLTKTRSSHDSMTTKMVQSLLSCSDYTMDDLCGTVLKHSDGWTVLQFPMIAEQDEQIQIGENLYHLRRAGDLLHPSILAAGCG